MGTLPEIIKTGFGDRNGYNRRSASWKTKSTNYRPALLNNLFCAFCNHHVAEGLVFHGIHMSISSVIKSLQDIMRKDAGWMAMRSVSVSSPGCYF